MKIGDSVKLKSGRKGIVEDYDDNFFYVRDDNGNLAKVKKGTKDSGNLVEPTEECVNAFKEELNKLGYEIKSERKGIFGSTHYQIKSLKNTFTMDDLKLEFEKLTMMLDELDERYNCKPTCNMGLMEDGTITAGVDIREMRAKDQVNDGIDMFSNEGKIDGIIEKTTAQKMFETAADSQSVGLYLSSDKKYLALVQVEGYYMGDTEDWEYDEEEGYEVRFAITKATEKLDLNSIEVVDNLIYESEGYVTEQMGIEGIDKILKKFIGNNLNSTDIEDSKTRDESAHMTFGEINNKFYEHNKENGIKGQFEDKNPLYGVAVISADSFDKEYPLEARSYKFRSDNKAFLSNMIGNSIIANSLDGSDTGVRLDWYMHGDTGDTWKIEYCYIENDNQVKDAIDEDGFEIEEVKEEIKEPNQKEFIDQIIEEIKRVFQTASVNVLNGDKIGYKSVSTMKNIGTFENEGTSSKHFEDGDLAGTEYSIVYSDKAKASDNIYVVTIKAYTSSRNQINCDFDISDFGVKEVYSGTLIANVTTTLE